MIKQKRYFSRRDFLKLAFTTGAATALTSLLEACNALNAASPTATLTRILIDTQTPTRTPTPTATATPTATPDLTAGLENLEINSFITESYKRLLLRDPESLTTLNLAGEYGVGNSELTDISDAYIRQTQALEAGILDLLGRYDPATFTPEQAMNVDIYRWYLDDQVRRHPFMYHDYPVTPFPWASVPYDLLSLFVDSQPMASPQDARDYISRLGQARTKFEQLLDGLQRRQAAGIILPRLLVSETITSLNEMIAGGASSTEFYLNFTEKINLISDLGPSDKEALREQAETAIEDSVIPGQRLIIDYFRSIQGIAPEDIGLWQFPNGSDYYAYILRHFTTTDATADEMHKLGLQHIKRIHLEMRQEFDRLGYPADEDIMALLDRMYEESGTVQGDETIAVIQQAMDRANAVIDQAFDIRLRGELQIVGGEIGNFFTPTPPGSNQPTTFYAATAWPQPKATLPTITFHETIPGHFLQLDVADQFNLPPFRTRTEFDGYIDGWALYAERLMWELGAYKNDPYGNLGRLLLELQRAVRVVADTGIHARHWTYDEAVAYMEQAVGSGGEAKRYIGYPAQAVSYFIGYLKILELRQRAMDTLGNRFSLKEFHHVLLCNGELPLALLEQLVDAYIVSQT